MLSRAAKFISPSANNKLMSSVTMGTKYQSIEHKLTNAFKPVHLEIINESHMHNVPPNSETHFKVIVVSDAFEGKSLLERHRMVNEQLASELQNGVHALSIKGKTPSQWDVNKTVDPSPSCMGGSKR